MSKFSEKRERQTARGRSPSWLWMGVVAGLLLLAWAGYALFNYRRSLHLDQFAQCLKAKGAKMYGAWWCPHCTDQKQELGHAFQYLNYVECSPQGLRTATQECKQAGIKHFPTWEFADGSRNEGVLALEELSRKTGCRWP